jgi:hypothetical protein
VLAGNITHTLCKSISQQVVGDELGHGVSDYRPSNPAYRGGKSANVDHEECGGLYRRSQQCLGILAQSRVINHARRLAD